MKERKPFVLCGGVRISISGHDPERFINIAVTRGIHICDIKDLGEGEIACWTTVKDLKGLKSIRKKTGVRIRIIERYGFPFLIVRNKGRKLLIIGFLSFLILLYSWSFYIWDISVEGNRKYTDETVFHFLEGRSVVCGIKKKDISCEQIEKEIRDQFREITWVSAEMTGTRLIIHVRENEALLSVDEEIKDSCHLAAKKAGTIVRNVIRSGICKVKAGDAVDAGQILVEGTIPIYDDAENLVNMHEICADAEIYAETKEVIQKTIPLIKTQSVRTGKKRQGLFVSVNEHPLYMMYPFRFDENWDYVMVQTQMKLFQNFYLPIHMGRIYAYETSTYERLWTEDEVREACERYQTEYIEKLVEKGVQILGCDGRIEKDESGWHYEGTLKLIENIAVETVISENQEENQTLNECN